MSSGAPKNSNTSNQRFSNRRTSANSNTSGGPNSSSSHGNTQPSHYRKSQPAKSKTKIKIDDKAAEVYYESTLYLLSSLIGLTVRVYVVQGDIYEGIFHSAETKNQLEITLRMARKVYEGKNERLGMQKITEQLTISAKSFMFMKAVDVDLTFAERGILSEASAGFKTDTDISAAQSGFKERSLEKWQPDASDNSSSNAAAFDFNITGKWDQFEVNEKLFGVKTDYKEELYTTKLDKNSEEYRKKEQEAERLAKEIEKQQSNNIHLAEERGQKLYGVNEEDLYGAVIRDDKHEAKTSDNNSQKKKSFAEMAKNDGRASPSKKQEKKSEAVTSTGSPADKKKSGFNPNASEFKFSASSSSFVPQTQAFVPQQVMPFVPPQAAVPMYGQQPFVHPGMNQQMQNVTQQMKNTTIREKNSNNFFKKLVASDMKSILDVFTSRFQYRQNNTYEDWKWKGQPFQHQDMFQMQDVPYMYYPMQYPQYYPDYSQGPPQPMMMPYFEGMPYNPGYK